MTEREFIDWIADLYAEKRSDITEICDEFLRTGKKPVKVKPECRFIRAMIPNTDIEIEYDTLSTKIMYHRPLSQWEDCVHHEYYDDDEEKES